ncbi:hypothetical protein BCR42DRAFT_419012, partial [Absidia repens]
MHWCYILLLYYLPFTLAHSTLDKRQAVASKACGDQNQTVGVCSPSSADTWYNNTYHELTWNYNNPVFNGFETLTFYLLQQNDSSSDYQQIKSFDVVHAVGVQVVLVDDSWYPSILPANSPNVTRTVFTYLIGSGVDLQQELDNSLSLYPRPSQFTMIQNSHNTTTTGADGSPSSSPSSTNQSSQNGSSSSLPAWAIAIIVIAAVAVVIAAIALAWLIRNMRRNRQRDHQPLNKTDMDHDEVLNNDNDNNNKTEMSQVGNAAAILGSTASTNNNNAINRNINHHIDTHDLSSSIHSSTPMMHGSVRGSPTVPSPTSIERSPSITTNTTSATAANSSSNMNPAALHLMQQQQQDAPSHQASSILSSTDALMIADTFRQFMRKPDWSDTISGTAGASGANLDDDNDDNETEEQNENGLATNSYSNNWRKKKVLLSRISNGG